jgi:hypothetical protein
VFAFLNDEEAMPDLRVLSESHQKHHHSRRPETTEFAQNEQMGTKRKMRAQTKKSEQNEKCEQKRHNQNKMKNANKNRKIRTKRKNAGGNNEISFVLFTHQFPLPIHHRRHHLPPLVRPSHLHRIARPPAAITLVSSWSHVSLEIEQHPICGCAPGPTPCKSAGRDAGIWISGSRTAAQCLPLCEDESNDRLLFPPAPSEILHPLRPPFVQCGRGKFVLGVDFLSRCVSLSSRKYYREGNL